jgi:hypothetical protein
MLARLFEHMPVLAIMMGTSFGMRLGRELLPAWLPRANGQSPMLYGDFANGHYWYNGSNYDGALTPWLNAIGGTFTRGSSGYYTNSQGLLASASSNALRFDYDPVALTPKGILLEGSSTNIVTQSQTFSTWAPTGATKTNNAATDPSGASTATLLTESSGGTFHSLDLSLGTGANSSTWALSAFVKPNGRNWVYLQNRSGQGFAYYNVSTAAIGTTGSGAHDTFVSATAVAYPNGWYRLIYISTFSTNDTLDPTIGLGSADNTASYSGNGTSGADVWGAQLENLGFATSYIATTSASVTRSADTLTLPSSQANTLTAIAKATMEGFSSGGRLIGVGSGKLINQSDSTHAQTDNGTNNSTATVSAWTSAQKVGVTGTGSSRAIAVNGGAATSDANALLSGAITNLYPMADNGSNPSYGDLVSIAAWNGLSVANGELSRLTQ